MFDRFATLDSSVRLQNNHLSAYRIFDRRAWSRLRANTPLSISSDDIEKLRGLIEHLSLDEVSDIFLPLSRLLNLQVKAARGLSLVQDTFLGRSVRPSPYIIGVAGSVAVGKSTFARVLQAILSRWPDHPKVDLVTTDGFLYSRKELEKRGLMQRKGFPESYNLRRMMAFLAAAKSGLPAVAAPVYSHLTYDLVSNQEQVVRSPDILIFEGLNVLQTNVGASLLASDFFDFSVYIDADKHDIAAWYIERFLVLQRTAFRDASSYFHRHKDLPESEVVALARGLWHEINLPNLENNILPTRERARLVLRKNADHRVGEVWLRRV
jgi:type I pantothenate kinase